jgi:hypothetical protein
MQTLSPEPIGIFEIAYSEANASGLAAHLLSAMKLLNGLETREG